MVAVTKDVVKTRTNLELCSQLNRIAHCHWVRISTCESERETAQTGSDKRGSKCKKQQGNDKNKRLTGNNFNTSSRLLTTQEVHSEKSLREIKTKYLQAMMFDTFKVQNALPSLLFILPILHINIIGPCSQGIEHITTKSYTTLTRARHYHTILVITKLLPDSSVID